jgi:hypothetical protein
VRPIKPAAVLVPIIEGNELSVLFTQRTAHLADHAGQISFPGGKIDASDESPATAALREADDAFQVPLAFLMAPQNHKRAKVATGVGSPSGLTRCSSAAGTSGGRPQA